MLLDFELDPALATARPLSVPPTYSLERRTCDILFPCSYLE